MADLGPEAACAVVILAAGNSTRMNSSRTKVVHDLAGRPVIGWLIETVQALRPTAVVGVIGPNMADVAALLAPHPTVVQDPPLGTGDAVRQAEPVLRRFAGDVLVLYGDTPLITLDTLTALRARRQAPDDPAVVALGFRPSDPGQYGRMVTAGDGTLEAIVEAGEATPDQLEIPSCNSGVMAIDGTVLFSLLAEIDNDNAKGEFYLTDIVARARAAGRVCAVVEGRAEEFLGINDRADLAAAEAAIQDILRARAMAAGATLVDPKTVWFSHDTRLGRDVAVGPDVFFGRGVTVGDGVEIRPFCHLEQVHVRQGATIGPFARLRGDTIVGANARIGNFVEVKAASVEDGAKISHLSYIGDARVGASANIGAGTITCNYDGFVKNRTDIGAGAFIGSNSALVAPVEVGDRAIVGAGSVITSDVAADALAVTRPPQKDVPDGAARFRRTRGKT